MDPIKARYARRTSARTLGEIVDDADVFLGVSAGGVLKREMVKRMAKDPLILALANPSPEIAPEDAKAVRPDAIIATGRSDYPNQVNNVLCFPYLFRGALDVGATSINEEMKSAAVLAIADLAHAEMSDVVAAAYRGQRLEFGPDYLIPTPFDPRLIERVAPAVAKAAMEGIATRLRIDFEAYRQRRGLMPPWVVFSLISLLRRHPLDIIRISVRTPQGLLEKGLAQSLKRSCGDDHIWL